MAGTTPTPKNYDITHIQQGPGDLWILGAGGIILDSATPQVVQAADGTPDSNTYASAVHLGTTTGSMTIVATPKMEDIKVDQADGPVARYLTELEMSIEADLAQLDPAILQEGVPFATYSTVASPGYKQLAFGGLGGLIPPVCVCVIAQKRGVAAGKYVVSVLFNAHGTVGISTAIGRSKAASVKAQFKAITDLTRTAGRQMGVIYETL